MNPGVRSLRLLMIQTVSRPTSEVADKRRLLGGIAERRLPISTMVVQGVRQSGDQQGAAVVAGLRSIPDVRVVPVKMGTLGRPRQGSQTRLTKLRAVADLAMQLPRLRSDVTAFRPDLVYSSQQLWDLRLADWLGYGLHRPRVVHLHYGCGPWLGASALRSMGRADLIVCVSAYIARQATQAFSSVAVETLHNPIDVPPEPAEGERAKMRSALAAELGAAPDAIFVGMVSRLHPTKGQDLLLSAMVPILRARPNVQLLLIGGQEPYVNGFGAGLRQIAAQGGVAGQVKFLGHREDVGRLLYSLDVFVHPSRKESFGLSIVEAMAHGLPVVALAEGGPIETIRHERTGLLVDPEDPEALSRAVEQLITDPDLRLALGREARRDATIRFDPGVLGERLFNMLAAAATA